MQKSLKVMLVDDEVMALNNLKNMIDWEQAGFRIVASETNPRKALDSFKKLKPRIVLVDIQMPVMNGLELSREILSLDIPVKIIILTSYKDFQYAKRAIGVGISNYLVKHELNEENLTLELERLKTELFNDQTNDEIIRHRLLRSVIDNTISSKYTIEKIFNRYIDFEIERLLFLFCKVDIPYFLFDKHEERSRKNTRQLVDVIKSSGIGLPSDIFGLNVHESVVVVYLEKQKIKEETEKIVSGIFSKIEMQIALQDETVSVYPLITCNNINEIMGKYTLVQRVFDYSIFLGRNKIIDSDNHTIFEGTNTGKLLESLKRVENLLSDFDSEGVELFLDRIFKKVATPPWDPGELRKLCNYLVGLLDDFLVKTHSPDLVNLELDVAFYSGLDDLFQVNDILNWFKNIFNYIIHLAKENRSKKYSPKVDQALEFIHKNYMEDWAIDDISNMLNISEVYLRKIFKTETGVTIIHYLTNLRMEKAISFLKTGNYKIFEIAEMVGYNTSQYFSKAFRKHTGKSPVDYVSGK